MCSEDLECGICYEPYHAGGRSPRELTCKHSFCESCLVALCVDDVIRCPLCRQLTLVPDVAARVRAAVRVNTCAFDRMLTAGVPLDDVNGADDVTVGGGALLDDETADDNSGDSPTGSGVARFRRSVKKMCRRIIGSKPRERDCVTDEEFRVFAMMSFYTF